MRESGATLGTNPRGNLARIAIALAALTGLIHVYVGITRGRVSLLLAGLGFFGGIGVFLAGYWPGLIFLAGIGYVLLQIVLWLVFQAEISYAPIQTLSENLTSSTVTIS